MTNALKKYNALKSRLDQLQRRADKAEGAWNQLKKRLRSEFGCTSLKHARQKLAELKQEQEELEAELEQELAQFQKQYGNLL